MLEINDKKLGELLRQMEGEMPSQVRTRIDDTLSSLPERKKKMKKSTMIASGIVASVAILLGTGFTNSTMAQVLQSIPFIGSVFTHSKDSTLKTTVEKGLSQTINKSATDKGITVTVNEVIFDGTRVSIGYVVQSQQALEDNVNPSIGFKIDGKQPGNYGVGGNSERYDDHTILGVMHLDSSTQLPGKFDLDVNFNKLGDTEGNWNIYFPVEEITSENKVILPMEKRESGDISLIVEKVTFAPTSTEVVYKLKQPAEREMELSFELYGSDGKALEPLSMFKENGTVKISYEPFKTIPKEITFRPQLGHDQEIDQKLSKLEMNLQVK
ncbi:DUF4179 domain-containing protein [Neobacillus niacini]|uniref:DUF4179 domain-containing protein n=1 Tax=Neobacillus niacini TaxID=86668 RepID=UPI0021CB4149|nr:DUF4179 domain-containing protein [Neobacillus niacini]MCM3766387.1 DUF4179 domain-containing protein [Neobacillus niacini]